MEKKSENHYTSYDGDDSDDDYILYDDGDDRHECPNDAPQIFYDYYFNETRRYDRENREYDILDDYFEILNINYYNKNTINDINKLK